MAALRRSKPVVEDDEPVASTSTLPKSTEASNLKESEEWLDALRPQAELPEQKGLSEDVAGEESAKPDDGSGKEKRSTSLEETEKGEEEQPPAKRRKTVVDAKAANLPARPNFVTSFPKDSR